MKTMKHPPKGSHLALMSESYTTN